MPLLPAVLCPIWAFRENTVLPVQALLRWASGSIWASWWQETLTPGPGVLLSTHSVSLRGWRAGCWTVSVPAKLLPMRKSRAHPCTLQDTGCPLYSRLRLCSGSIFPDTLLTLGWFCFCVFLKKYFSGIIAMPCSLSNHWSSCFLLKYSSPVALSLSPWWLGWVAPGSVLGLHLFLLPLLSCCPPQGSVLNSQTPLCILTACGQSISKCKCLKPDTSLSPGPASVPAVLISPMWDLGKAGLILSLHARCFAVSSASNLSSVARIALLSLTLSVPVLLWAALLLPLDFPGDSDGKAPVYNAGYPGSIPVLGRSSGEGNGNPLQYSCLE